jgi:DNA-binding transcriptional MerR regulator
MKMKNRQFRIGQLAAQLKVEKFVIRFWEKEFGCKTIRSAGKQRFYNQKDLEQFVLIKELLYEKGFTIAGAKKHLSQITQSSSTTLTDQMTAGNTHINQESPDESNPELAKQIVALQQQLIKLRELL